MRKKNRKWSWKSEGVLRRDQCPRGRREVWLCLQSIKILFCTHWSPKVADIDLPRSMLKWVREVYFLYWVDLRWSFSSYLRFTISTSSYCYMGHFQLMERCPPLIFVLLFRLEFLICFSRWRWMREMKKKRRKNWLYFLLSLFLI